MTILAIKKSSLFFFSWVFMSKFYMQIDYSHSKVTYTLFQDGFVVKQLENSWKLQKQIQRQLKEKHNRKTKGWRYKWKFSQNLEINIQAKKQTKYTLCLIFLEVRQLTRPSVSSQRSLCSFKQYGINGSISSALSIQIQMKKYFSIGLMKVYLQLIATEMKIKYFIVLLKLSKRELSKNEMMNKFIHTVLRHNFNDIFQMNKYKKDSR
ncbi:hypothetical protein TTHERM_000927042 (macronuclear) [Tetrahymena thermophila SB210]|uniref:Uncharacterized protein n=1 Tax=Tetrahymena thermophila (strain SB210) TaxID=312017 RepID=W7X6N8_TETTS|nr:hypothetical protein TTHERM_000927042 [Tetrahymena thermophila SB210]EWS75045.1 hypothetical protein TTHERM_000927042 [Tetrahymena thermophila SB210]|eukprot:XP_012652420.1 hypothetical protein TTHERM_000927042 [Tetrahymena thermophila SB210]